MFRICALLVLLGEVHTATALDPRKALTQYSISVWTQQQGLPQNTIFAIAQTNDSYLWLATDDGLARFDGYEFVVFSRDHRDLPSNSITALAAGNDGSLWIGSRSGLTRYKDQRFRNYTRKDGLPDDLVTALFVDHAGILWVVAGGNLSRFDGSVFTNFLRVRDIPLTTVRAVTEDKRHNLIIAGVSSVVKREEGGRFISMFDPSVLSADFPSGILVDHAGNLWVSGIKGLVERFPDGHIRRFGKSEGLPSSVFGLNTLREDRDGSIWVGTGRGIARLEGERFRETDWGEPSLVRCVLEDREGNLWLGSNNGLIRFRDDAFTIYGKSEGLPGDEPSALFQDRSGRNWVGFDTGAVLMNGDKSWVPEVLRGKSNGSVYRFRETPSRELLLATRDGLIRMKDHHAEVFIAPDPQHRTTVFDAMEDAAGTLWLALPNGLGELVGGKVRIVIQAGPLFAEDSFSSLAQGSDGSMWAGTQSDGLWRYKDGQKRLFTTADGLGSNQIRALYQDRDKTLWIGTRDGGLNALRGGKVIRYTARDGLPSDNIHKVTDDGDSLWLCTARGISRVSKQQLLDFSEHRIQVLRPETYGVADGLRSEECEDGDRHVDGSLWFATSRGVAVFDPHARKNAVLPPLIHVLNASMDGRRFVWANTPRVPPGNGRLQIRYTAVHLRAPDQVRYSYRLIGLDSNWVRAEGPRAVDYDRLGHGHYQFSLRAELPAGPSTETSFEFDLLPHFYETAWFRSLSALALAAMIWLVYKLRETQVRSRFAMVLEERARLAREVHDTMAQGFVGIASQLDAIAMITPADGGPARRGLDLARRMARHSLTEARRSLVDLRSADLENQDLAGALESGAHQWVANSGIDVEVDVKGEAGGLPEEVAHHVFRIAQEAVANAVNHANGNQITLKLKIDPRQLNLQILDNGRGFDTEDIFTSKNGNFGLIGMRERAKRLGGRLRIESQPCNGTLLEVTVPLK